MTRQISSPSLAGAARTLALALFAVAAVQAAEPPYQNKKTRDEVLDTAEANKNRYRVTNLPDGLGLGSFKTPGLSAPNSSSFVYPRGFDRIFVIEDPVSVDGETWLAIRGGEHYGYDERSWLMARYLEAWTKIRQADAFVEGKPFRCSLGYNRGDLTIDRDKIVVKRLEDIEGSYDQRALPPVTWRRVGPARQSADQVWDLNAKDETGKPFKIRLSQTEACIRRGWPDQPFSVEYDDGTIHTCC